MAKKKYEQYRQEIYYLDAQIEHEEDKEVKIKLIDENIELNKQYIQALHKSIPVKIVFCVLLSILYLLGLVIFLPQIITRKNKIAACQRRIISLEAMKDQLTR